MNHTHTAEDYEKYEPLLFPMTLPKSGFIIDEFTTSCPACDSETSDLRFRVRNYGQCDELEVLGLCHSCKIISQVRLRVYGDGHMLATDENGWRRMRAHPHVWWHRLRKFLGLTK